MIRTVAGWSGCRPDSLVTGEGVDVADVITTDTLEPHDGAMADSVSLQPHQVATENAGQWRAGCG